MFKTLRLNKFFFNSLYIEKLVVSFSLDLSFCVLVFPLRQNCVLSRPIGFPCQKGFYRLKNLHEIVVSLLQTVIVYFPWNLHEWNTKIYMNECRLNQYQKMLIQKCLLNSISFLDTVRIFMVVRHSWYLGNKLPTWCAFYFSLLSWFPWFDLICDVTNFLQPCTSGYLVIF